MKKPTGKTLVALAIALAVVGLAIGEWFAKGSISSTIETATYSLDVTGGDFSVDNMVPGDRIARIVKVSNTGTEKGYLTIDVALTSGSTELAKYLEVIYFGKDTKVPGGPWWYTTEEVTWCDYPGSAIDRAFTGEDNMTQGVKTSSWTSKYAPWHDKLDEHDEWISLYDLSQILDYLGSTAPDPGEYHQVYLKLQLRSDAPDSLQGKTLTFSLDFTLNQRSGKDR